MTDSVKAKQYATMPSKVTFRVFSEYNRIEELDDGYALYFPSSKKWRLTLQEFVGKWSQTCPFFSIDILEDNDHGTLRLDIRGPEGTKDFIEGANHILTSSLNPAPSRMQKFKRMCAFLTADFRLSPDFLIIGAMKCGTTSLYSYLLQHPDVATASRKEVEYFDYNYWRGPRWYRQHFPLSVHRALHRLMHGAPLQTGEASPEYLFSAKVCERIATAMPEVKLIAILRNPIDRAHSAYQHEVRVGWETRTFEEAIEVERKKNEVGRGHYLGRGVYVKHLDEWLKRFPREQLMICTTESLQKSPRKVFSDAVDFLGLRAAKLQTSRKLNAVPYPQMKPATRIMLREYFQPHNERLGELLECDLDWS